MVVTSLFSHSNYKLCRNCVQTICYKKVQKKLFIAEVQQAYKLTRNILMYVECQNNKREKQIGEKEPKFLRNYPKNVK